MSLIGFVSQNNTNFLIDECINLITLGGYSGCNGFGGEFTLSKNKIKTGELMARLYYPGNPAPPGNLCAKQ